MNGNRLPVSITHYYNFCDSDKDEFGMGYGWRTSLHQTLHKVLYNGEVALVYTDGDGARNTSLRRIKMTKRSIPTNPVCL